MDIHTLRAAIGFERFECKDNKLPYKVGDKVRVKTHVNRSGSAFSQMAEEAIFGGYVETTEGLKALVMMTEREDDKGNYDYLVVPTNHLRPPAAVCLHSAYKKNAR